MTGHLIHIGYPKTGSNFLRRWFLDHPQLGYADGGIGGFRDVFDIARQGAAARDEIRYRVTSCEGLATPHRDVGLAVELYRRDLWSSFRETQAVARNLLSSLFPAARILIVTRGFEAMVRSSYSQFVRTGGDLPFAAYCAGIEAAANRSDDPWNYDALIALYAQAFGSENVIAMPYEMLRDDAVGFVQEIERRLGLSHHSPRAGRVNAGLSSHELAWYPRLIRSASLLPLGDRVRGRLRRVVVRQMSRGRLRNLVRGLDAVFPAAGTSMEVPVSLLHALRGRADRLANDPLYARYADEYRLK